MTRALVTTLLLAAAIPAAGQSWQTVTQSRRLGDTEQLRVRVRYAAGDLRVSPAAAGQLYRLSMRYDQDLFEPNIQLTPQSASLNIDLESRRGRSVNIDWDDDHQSLDLALTSEVPLDLDLGFGAVEADIDLGGLNLRSLELQTGASQTAVRFGAPNPGACDQMTIRVGAAEFDAVGLANARCRRIEVQAGVGGLTLEFGGSLPADFTSAVEVSVGLGGVELQIPESAGVRIRVRRFLASFERHGFIRRGDYYYSPNWEEATSRLDIEVRAALGGIEIRRIADAS